MPFQPVHFSQSDLQALHVCIFVCKYGECVKHLFLQAIREMRTKHDSYFNYGVHWNHFVAFLKSVLVLLKSDASYHATGWNFDLP